MAVTALTGSADASGRKTLRGKTNQGLRVKVAASRSSIKVLHFTARLNCNDGSTLTVIESGFMRTKLDRNGRFKDRQLGNTDTVYLRGKKVGRSLKGSLRVTDKEGGVACHSKWLRFRLH
jgi:hypothetical protein